MNGGLALAVPARTYGAAALTPDGKWWRLTEVEPHVSIRLKHIFPAIPKAAVPPFRIPHNMASDSDLLWFLGRYPLRMSDTDRGLLEGGSVEYAALQASMERILLPDYQPPAYAGLRPGQAVRAYQAQAVEIAMRSRGLLLGDECGLGKTFTGAALCLQPGTLPAAIVCQVHIQKQWVRVLEEFTTLRVHRVKTRSSYSLPEADVYVFRYSQLMGWSEVFNEGFFRSVVWDEPQELRGGVGTDKGRAAAVLADRVAHRLGLTATPIYGYGVEVYQVMRFINDEVLGGYDDFMREFVGSTGKLKDPKALGAFLREQYAFLRRTKADVGKELEPVNRVVDLVPYDAEKVRSIEETARALALRAVTGAFVERGNAARELDLLARQATGVAKARGVADVVRILVEGGEPVVLFGWHRDVYAIWLERLADLCPAMYTGSESASQKAASVDAFRSGRTDILIMSLRSAAGLDGLQSRCSTAVFGELDWSPGVHHQCIERFDREGQEKPVTALFLVTDDGSDPPMMEMLGLKSAEARAVIDPTGEITQAHSDRTRIQALVSRYLGRQVEIPEAVVDGVAAPEAAPVQNPTRQAELAL